MVRRTFADVPRLLLERHYLQGHLTTPHLHYSTANFECGAAFSTLQFYTAARCTSQLRTAIAPSMAVALLVIRALTAGSTTGRSGFGSSAARQPHHNRLLFPSCQRISTASNSMNQCRVRINAECVRDCTYQNQNSDNEENYLCILFTKFFVHR